MSEEVKAGQIFQLMANVQKDIPGIGKTGYNKFHKYKYRSIDDIMDGIHAALSEHSIVCLPEVVQDSIKHTEHTTTSGDIQTMTEMLVEFTFIAPDGSSVSCMTLGQGMDTGDKHGNKAHTSAYKTAMSETFCIHISDVNIDSEDDSDESENQRPGYTNPDGQQPVNGGPSPSQSNGGQRDADKPASTKTSGGDDRLTRVKTIIKAEATKKDMDAEELSRKHYKKEFDDLGPSEAMNMLKRLGYQGSVE